MIVVKVQYNAIGAMKNLQSHDGGKKERHKKRLET
jgi:hypothetical protein